VSDFLRALQHELRTQDNATTADPYFLVQRRFHGRWEFVQAFLTRKAAEAFIQREAHNYPKGLSVYVESACRNPEMAALRKAILALEVPQ
jgi:hypothetical protein